jgi:hypothetical protein
MNVAVPWDPKFEADLDQRAAKALQDGRTAGLPAVEKERLRGVNAAIHAVLSITIIYLQGFDEIAKGGPLAASVSPDVVNWVKAVPRGDSGTRLAGIAATSLCSILEDFIADVADAKITPALIAKLRPTRNLDADPLQATGQLQRAIKPSVKADGAKWLKAVEDVFGLTVDQPFAGSLLPLIAFRNLFVHDPPEAFKIAVNGEQVKCWALAVQLLASEISLAP